MGHNDFIRPDGQWPPETVVTPGDARALDVAQFQAVNGDAGGTWVPSKPVAFGGKGLALNGGLHQIAGGLRTQSGGRVVLGHSDFPTFKTPASRTVTVPLLDYALYYYPSPGTPLTPKPLLTRSLATPGTTISAVLPFGQQLIFPFPKRYMHSGATLASAALTLAIGQSHAVVPAAPPSVQVYRSDYFAGSACQAFAADAAYGVQDLVIPSTPNGYFYSVTGAGTATSEPTWPTTYGATVFSGSVTFTCEGTTWAGSPTYADPHAWEPSTTYVAGRYIQPSPATGQFFACVTVGVSGPTEPVWQTAVGSLTTDGTATWRCMGSMLPILSGTMTAANAIAYYAGGAPQAFTLAPVTGGPSVINTAAFSYSLFVTDETGAGALLPSLNTYIAAQLAYAEILDMRFE